MRGRLFVALLVVGCSTSRADPAPGAPPASGAAAPAGDARVTEIRPLPIAGPFPSLADACRRALPCGGTQIDEKTGHVTRPPARPDCSAVLDPAKDENLGTASGDRAELVHGAGDREIQIGGVACAVPKGLRGSESRYHVFIKRPDGWWRSDPVFVFNYNDKYCAGSMMIRWNDQPGRTFAGLAATRTCLTCSKQGNEDDTLELMIRVETQGARPIVFQPLAVGERNTVTPDAQLSPGIDCKPSKHHVSMTESWSSADELVLTGPASWRDVPVQDGVIFIGLGQSGRPSTAGRYRFTR